MPNVDHLYGESKNIEYKLVLPSNSTNYTKTAVAFANGQGGRIVFGVEDNTWRVVGIPDDRVFSIMDAISNAVVDSCEPLIIPDIAMQDIDGKTVIVVEILPGLQRPYYIKSLGRDQGTFVRVAGTTRLADGPTIKELMFEGSNRSFDQTPCVGISASEDDIAALCKVMTVIAQTSANGESDKIKQVTTQQLISWGVLARQSELLVPTNAYAILTGSDTIRSVIQCGVFKGDTKAIFVDRREFSGTPQELIEQAYQYVLRNIHMGAQFKGVYRQDVYEIPPDAIRELIINAIVHRSYIDHSSIQIAIYDNRLEITSPGRLPIGQNLERMKQGYSKIRNEALAAAFEYMGYIEHWGSGIPRIVGEVREAGLKEPEFLGGDTDLRVNIYRADESAASTNIGRSAAWDSAEGLLENAGERRTSAGPVPDQCRTLTSQQKLIYEHILQHQQITPLETRHLLGVKERRARTVLGKLISLGLIQRLGAAQQTRYAITNANQDGVETHE